MPGQTAPQLQSQARNSSAIETIVEILSTIWGFFPLSLAGLTGVVLGYVAFSFFGKSESDYVLYAAGLVAMGVVLVDLVFVLLASAWLLFSV